MSKNKNDLSLSTIAKELDIQLVGGTGKETFNGISIDSRTLEPNDIFAVSYTHLRAHETLRYLV